jgi:hypothetical protein
MAIADMVITDMCHLDTNETYCRGVDEDDRQGGVDTATNDMAMRR